jgi:hypothetical protein
MRTYFYTYEAFIRKTNNIIVGSIQLKATAFKSQNVQYNPYWRKWYHAK